MNDDTALLQRYAADGAQDAFAELVRRHLGLVYHAALRQTGGDPHRAQEVAQIVFTDLARKAAALAARPHLVAWLHTGTRLAAAQLHRTEARRLVREHAAFTMSADELSSAREPDADWERLRPLVDDALQSLGELDRTAVLLRFFENRSYAEIAAALDVNQDAARVRANRALEKLRATLARRGVVSTASALGLALVQPALASTPPGLAAHITSTSLSAAASSAVATGTFAAVTVMSTAKIVAGSLAASALTALSLGFALGPDSRSPQPTALAPTATSAESPPPAAPAGSPRQPPPTPANSATPPTPALKIPPRLIAADATDALTLYLALPPLPTDADATAFNERAAQLRALLTILPSESFTILLDALAVRAGESENRLRGLAFEVWTERDAPVAARWADALVPGPPWMAAPAPPTSAKPPSPGPRKTSMPLTPGPTPGPIPRSSTTLPARSSSPSPRPTARAPSRSPVPAAETFSREAKIASSSIGPATIPPPPFKPSVPAPSPSAASTTPTSSPSASGSAKIPPPPSTGSLPSRRPSPRSMNSNSNPSSAARR